MKWIKYNFLSLSIGVFIEFAMPSIRNECPRPAMLFIREIQVYSFTYWKMIFLFDFHENITLFFIGKHSMGWYFLILKFDKWLWIPESVFVTVISILFTFFYTAFDAEHWNSLENPISLVQQSKMENEFVWIE